MFSSRLQRHPVHYLITLITSPLPLITANSLPVRKQLVISKYISVNFFGSLKMALKQRTYFIATSCAKLNDFL
jgi:hypothetical protein